MADEQPDNSERPGDEANPPPAQLQTREDRWRKYVADQMVDTMVEVDELNSELSTLQLKEDEAKEAVKEKKSEIAGCNAKLRHFASQMRDIRDGKFVPPLFDKFTGETLALPVDVASDPAAAGSADPGDDHPIGILTQFGITARMVELLEESQLAQECRLKTIGDLKRVMAIDAWWHKKVKGFGDTKINLLTDALTAHQQANSLADARPQRCTFEACHGAIFVDGKCPKCGNSMYFERVDPDEPPLGEQPGDETPPDQPEGDRE